MTEKLYDLDAYATEFEAEVLECTPDKNGFLIVLDRTLFFPEEGGQSCDKGTINNIEVDSVKIKNNVIYHMVSKPVSVGTKVKGCIDFNHRFSNMQMHSGEHIFTGLIHNKYGLNNVGFHLSDNSATMDYDGKLTPDQLHELEKEANSVIFSNREIKAYYPDKEELRTIDYRSKKEIDGDIRIVIVDGVDICACCAPHVHKTGEIGLFKIVSYENYKGGIRVHYLCGYRALEHYGNRINELKQISNLLTVKEFSEASAVSKLYDDNRNLKYEVVSLKNSIIHDKIVSLVDHERDFLLYIGGAEDIPSMKYALEVMHSVFDGTCAFFAGDETVGFRYLIERTNGDVSEINNKLKSIYNAKGGGRNDSIQGSVNIKPDEIESLFL